METEVSASDTLILPEVIPSPFSVPLSPTDSVITIRIPKSTDRAELQRVQSSLLEVQYDNEFYDALFTNILLREKQQPQQEQLSIYSSSPSTQPPSLPVISSPFSSSSLGNDMIVVAAYDEQNNIVGIASARIARGQEEIDGNEEDTTNIFTNLWNSTTPSIGIVDTVTNIWNTVTGWLPSPSPSPSSSSLPPSSSTDNNSHSIRNYPLHSTINVGYIMTLGILPKYRRKGIAQLLLKFLYEQVQNLHQCKAITLHCVATNIAAQKLYLKEGFQILKLLPLHYYFHKKYHDAIFMKKVFESDNDKNNLADVANIAVIPVHNDSSSIYAVSSPTSPSPIDEPNSESPPPSLSVTDWLTNIIHQYIPWINLHHQPQ